jgi:uncharacterized membrane protein
MNTITTGRIKSIDLLRGLIMLIMALDHTRDYFHADSFMFDPLDLHKTTLLLYFTRWITHLCAPIFVLLAGTSAFISGQRKTTRELASFLIKRGIWLIILEETVVNFAWFFNIEFSFFILGVIWVLGFSMIILAGLIFLPKKVILFTGLIMVFGHNLLDNIHFPEHNFMGFAWGMLHERKVFIIGHRAVMEGYHIIPWAGVMALGYCLGEIFAKGFDTSKRKRILLQLGTASIILFIIIRGINVYGNLYPWSHQATHLLSFLSFMDISKYPPSLDYLLITEGIGLVFLALTENVSNGLSKAISVYGRVPMFYYLLHIYLIHLLAILAVVLTGHPWTDMTSFTTWISLMPNLRGYGFSLGVVYLIWIAVIVILYPLCKMYDEYKARNKDKWWLSYL